MRFDNWNWKAGPRVLQAQLPKGQEEWIRPCMLLQGLPYEALVSAQLHIGCQLLPGCCGEN